MTSAHWNLPAGLQVLGRVISPTGEPLDDSGPLASVGRPTATATAGALFETGIKVLDVFAPILHGATVGLSSPAGVGKLVLMSELIQRLVSQYNGAAVLVGSDDHALEVNDMMRMMRESGVDRQIAMVFTRSDDDEAVRRQAVPTAWALARDLAGSGPVLLFVERQLAVEQATERLDTANPVTVVYFDHEEADQPSTPAQTGPQLDAQIVLTRDLAQRKIWPAIDPRHSRSRLLEAGALGAEHAALVSQAQALMARPDDAIGAQLLVYGSQPFYTAELYTGQPGAYVPLATALADYAGLAAGRYAERSAESLTFIGSLETR